MSSFASAGCPQIYPRPEEGDILINIYRFLILILIKFLSGYKELTRNIIAVYSC